MRKLGREAMVLFALGAWLFLAPRAAAFCRATTCDPKLENCPRNDERCLSSGAPLYWASSCLTMNVHSTGSLKRGISAQQTQDVLQRAFDAWTMTSCDGGGTPSIHMELGAVVECDRSELNEDGKNANIVTYRDDSWPYPGSADAYALTIVRYGVESGRIRDVDIELNGADQPLGVGDPVEGADLASILTHEVGHLFGLDHTLDAEATMFSTYELGDDSLRTLSADDTAAICSVYPPTREPETSSCEPYRGFSPLCAAEQPPGGEDEPEAEPSGTRGGCAVAAGGRGAGSAGLLGGIALLRLLRRRRLVILNS